MNELWRLSATEVARLVRTRKVSAREVADAALQRLDSVNPQINAIVDCRPDHVREQADLVDIELARGNDPGPLAGVPVTVKINIDQAGFATTDGSRLYENRIAKFNSPAVDNMVRAGAVLLGRSNAPTFAIRIGEVGEAGIVSAPRVEPGCETSVPSSNGRLVPNLTDVNPTFEHASPRGLEVGDDEIDVAK